MVSFAIKESNVYFSIRQVFAEYFRNDSLDLKNKEFDKVESMPRELSTYISLAKGSLWISKMKNELKPTDIKINPKNIHTIDVTNIIGNSGDTKKNKYESLQNISPLFDFKDVLNPYRLYTTDYLQNLKLDYCSFVEMCFNSIKINKALKYSSNPKKNKLEKNMRVSEMVSYYLEESQDCEVLQEIFDIVNINSNKFSQDFFEDTKLNINNQIETQINIKCGSMTLGTLTYLDSATYNVEFIMEMKEIPIEAIIVTHSILKEYSNTFNITKSSEIFDSILQNIVNTNLLKKIAPELVYHFNKQ